MNFRLRTIDLIGRTEINKWYDFLQQSQYWSIEEQKVYQNEKLRKLVKHAYKNVPYYKNLFLKLHLSPEDISTKEDLQKIPVIRKKDLQEKYNELLADNHRKFHSQFRSTGGTTGLPTKYVSDKTSWSLHWALKYRAWEWSKYKIGDKVAIFGSTSLIPEEKPSLSRKVWNRINNFYPLPATHLSKKEMDKYAAVINRNKIKCIRGYPSSIAHFADFCMENDIKLDIESIITTAEVLQPNYKENIIKSFNPILIDSYGCADGGGNANNCLYNNGFHISFESAIWEVCDDKGKPVNSNETGEVTLSSLTNYAMPLLRYQPGDIIENNFKTEACQCGCKLPRIKKIVGRTTDILKFSNNVSISGPALTVLFSKFSIKKYQIIQNTMSTLDIKLIPDDQFDKKQYNQIVELMQHHCGSDIKICLHTVDDIPLPSSGKHRFIINNTLK